MQIFFFSSCYANMNSLFTNHLRGRERERRRVEREKKRRCERRREKRKREAWRLGFLVSLNLWRTSLKFQNETKRRGYSFIYRKMRNPRSFTLMACNPNGLCLKNFGPGTGPLHLRQGISDIITVSWYVFEKLLQVGLMKNIHWLCVYLLFFFSRYLDWSM